MFNPEKLLGGLLKQGMRGGRLGGKAAVGMGVLGVAMAAAEHYMNRPQTTGTTGAPPPPPPPGGPTMTPQTAPAIGATPPPPPPGATSGQAAGGGSSADDAVLLIRAMIAAANADGVIDEQERRTILGRLESVGVSDEERAFLLKELASPADPGTIAGAAAGNRELAKQVYAVSLSAITVDTDAERDYLARLAERLTLPPEIVRQIHDRFGVPS